MPGSDDEIPVITANTDLRIALDRSQAARLGVVRELLHDGVMDLNTLQVLVHLILTGEPSRIEDDAPEIPQLQPVPRTSPVNTEPIYTRAQQALQQQP